MYSLLVQSLEMCNEKDWTEQSGFAGWQTSGAPEEEAEQTVLGKKMTAWSFIR